ncbi:hypothetical protein Z947_2447 [Sulfitobacter geojensis]|nr:hypothetical protein Z947_2447 [Sulfitobacter geojensis]NYI29550.1 hypothetical protein [Sulfitobacter geojensis]
MVRSRHGLSAAVNLNGGEMDFARALFTKGMGLGYCGLI